MKGEEEEEEEEGFSPPMPVTGSAIVASYMETTKAIYGNKSSATSRPSFCWPAKVTDMIVTLAS